MCFNRALPRNPEHGPMPGLLAGGRGMTRLMDKSKTTPAACAPRWRQRLQDVDWSRVHFSGQAALREDSQRVVQISRCQFVSDDAFVLSGPCSKANGDGRDDLWLLMLAPRARGITHRRNRPAVAISFDSRCVLGDQVQKSLAIPGGYAHLGPAHGAQCGQDV